MPGLRCSLGSPGGGIHGPPSGGSPPPRDIAAVAMMGAGRRSPVLGDARVRSFARFLVVMTSLRSERGDRIASLAVLRGLLAALVLVVAGLVVAPGLAVARGSGYYVTFAARSCPTYSDVDANKARNDIQESLDDLGPDSPYNASGGLVDPRSRRPRRRMRAARCRTGRSRSGHGYQSLASVVHGATCPSVTDPFPRGPIVTQASTPLYDQYHNRVNGQSIAGRDDDPADRRRAPATASVSGQLWAQGGSPEDPVLAQQYPRGRSTGSLPCAVRLMRSTATTSRRSSSRRG